MVTNSFGKYKFLHAANEKAQHALMRGWPVFFLWGRGGLDGRFSFFVPNVFPWGSSSFPRRSQKHLSLVSYGLPKFNSRVYELKR